jgi:hypothetical protein
MRTLTQEEADQLMALIKVLEATQQIQFPQKGETMQLDAHSTEGRIKFIIDVNRGKINIKKCTYQTRYNRSIPLLRIDIEGGIHTNPPPLREKVPCPHIHIYREGFGDKWAYPLSSKIKTNPSDLVAVLSDFLEYNHVERRPPIVYQGDGLV